MSQPAPAEARKPRRWRRIARVVGVTSLVALVILVAYCWHAAGRLMAPSPAVIGDPPAAFPAEAVSLESDSGATIAGWHLVGKPGRGVVILVHGIGANRLGLLHRAELIQQAGFSTLLIDLRCHGESKSNEADAKVTLGYEERHDVKAAVEYARRQHPGEPIGVVGFSLGGAAAVLGSPLGIDAMVLEAVYPTIEAAVANRTERFGVLQSVVSFALLVQLQPRLGISPRELRPVDAIGAIDCPVLIVGGGKDRHTTPTDTRRLFAAANEPKELVWFPELAHSNFARWRPEWYRETVVRFLEMQLYRE